MVCGVHDNHVCGSFMFKFSWVTILQGVKFPIFLLIFVLALQQCSAKGAACDIAMWYVMLCYLCFYMTKTVKYNETSSLLPVLYLLQHNSVNHQICHCPLQLQNVSVFQYCINRNENVTSLNGSNISNNHILEQYSWLALAVVKQFSLNDYDFLLLGGIKQFLPAKTIFSGTVFSTQWQKLANLGDQVDDICIVSLWFAEMDWSWIIIYRTIRQLTFLNTDYFNGRSIVKLSGLMKCLQCISAAFVTKQSTGFMDCWQHNQHSSNTCSMRPIASWTFTVTVHYVTCCFLKFQFDILRQLTAVLCTVPVSHRSAADHMLCVGGNSEIAINEISCNWRKFNNAW